jgi:transposase
VNIALVVSREGLPLGYELFAGNRNDVTTLEEIVERIERLYGKAQRIWVMDRGMISEENVRYLQEAGRRYIVGTPKSMLRRFERELLAKDWYQTHEGLRYASARPEAEIFLLVRAQRRRARHTRTVRKAIEEGLRKSPPVVGAKAGAV